MIIQGATIVGATVIDDGSGPAPVGLGAITYDQMPPPVVPGTNLQDNTATVNGSVGFTINNSTATGVAVAGLTANNVTYYNNLGTGIFDATLGPGSTYATIAVNINQIPSSGQLVFFFSNAVAYPATFNYPITIS